MTFLPLLTIPLFFFLIALFKSSAQKYAQWNLCAICIAISLTWIFLLILNWTGFTIDPLMIGILMGMSATGLMYQIESTYKKNHLKHLWLTRLVMMTGGFYFILMILENKWSAAFVLIMSLFIILGILSFLLQGVTHADALKSAHVDEQKKSLLKKLDNCC